MRWKVEGEGGSQGGEVYPRKDEKKRSRESQVCKMQEAGWVESGGAGGDQQPLKKGSCLQNASSAVHPLMLGYDKYFNVELITQRVTAGVIGPGILTPCR